MWCSQMTRQNNFEQFLSSNNLVFHLLSADTTRMIPYPNSTSNLRPSPPLSPSVCQSAPALPFWPPPVLTTTYLLSRAQGEVHGQGQHGYVFEGYFRTKYIQDQRTCEDKFGLQEKKAYTPTFTLRMFTRDSRNDFGGFCYASRSLCME